MSLGRLWGSRSWSRNLVRFEYVYTIADIWSGHHWNFFGMTAHWIDSSSLKHHSAGLSKVTEK